MIRYDKIGHINAAIHFLRGRGMSFKTRRLQDYNKHMTGTGLQEPLLTQLLL